MTPPAFHTQAQGKTCGNFVMGSLFSDVTDPRAANYGVWHFLNLSDALTTEREQHGAGRGAGAAVNYRFVPGKVHSTKGHDLK